MSIKRNLLAAAAVLVLASPAAAADIVETAASNGSFTTLVAAAKAAGLVDTLKGPGPFTVFAPTDEAFKKLPAGTVENLLKPENKAQLTKVLTYHVVPGKVMASDVQGKKTTAKTIEGSAVAIDASGGAVKGGQCHGQQGGRECVQQRDPCDRHRDHAEVVRHRSSAWSSRIDRSCSRCPLNLCRIPSSRRGLTGRRHGN